VEAPTLERFEQLMLAMGQRLVVDVESLPSPLPPAKLAVSRRMTPPERLREAIGWNRAATELSIAGERARAERQPGTQWSGE
jgi:hypothetical protein